MKKKLLVRLSAMQFAMYELRLFSDTHPNDKDALEKYEKYEKKYQALKEEYEENYGPLTLDGTNSDEWLQNPWPWDIDFTKEEKEDKK